MSEKLEITTGGKERVLPASKLYAQAFETDPVVTYMLQSMPPSRRLSYLPSYMNAMLTAASMNNALFVEAGDWKNISVLMPPGMRVDNPWTIIQAGFIRLLWNVGIGGCQRMLMEFQPLSDASKKKGLQGQTKYYYIFFTATTEDERCKGLCSIVMRRFQDIARGEGVPIWLEATTEKSMRIYVKLGFEIVDVIVLGKGKADRNGNVAKDGEGVRIWSMVWWPAEK